ncbi:hypothetical protein IRJ41_016674, partial [Triplophysa rosa]
KLDAQKFNPPYNLPIVIHSTSCLSDHSLPTPFCQTVGTLQGYKINSCNRTGKSSRDSNGTRNLRTQIPVQCQDDPYPSNAVVVIGKTSYPLRVRTPDMTGYYKYVSRAGVINTENINADNAIEPHYGWKRNRHQPLERGEL